MQARFEEELGRVQTEAAKRDADLRKQIAQVEVDMQVRIRLGPKVLKHLKENLAESEPCKSKS